MATARLSVLGKQVAAVIVHPVQAGHPDPGYGQGGWGGRPCGIRPILPVAFNRMEEFDDQSCTLLLWIAPS